MKSRKYVGLLWDCLYVYWDIINSNSVAYTCISIIVCVLNIFSQKKNVVYGKLPQKRGRTLTPESAGRYPVGTALINPGAREARPAGPGLPAGGDAADYD